MATIKDIAKITGLSIGTISKYINGKNVREQNARTIQEAIDSLNYQVNPFASGLKANRSMSVGILLHHWQNPFLMSMISVLENRLYSENYTINVCAYNGSRQQEYDKFQFITNRSDAVIFMPLFIDAEYLGKQLVREIPLISIDRPIPGYDCDTVLLDSLNTAYDVTERFINAGHRRIALIAGTEQVFTAQESVTGYTRALGDYGLPVDPGLIAYGDYHETTGYHIMQNFLKMDNPPTAIYTATNEMMTGALAAIDESDYSVPEDISFIGVNEAGANIPHSMHISQPLFPSETMADVIADLIISRIRGEMVDFPRMIRLKSVFHEGNTVRNL